jgi:hypothetical protein
MVTIGEVKKSEVAYENINHIILTNLNTSVDLNHVISFHESDLEIEIETYLPSDNIQRGWVGDMYYEINRGLNIETCEKANNVYKKCVKDVLLARVNSYKDGPECVIFTYTFLKY